MPEYNNTFDMLNNNAFLSQEKEPENTQKAELVAKIEKENPYAKYTPEIKTQEEQESDLQSKFLRSQNNNLINDKSNTEQPDKNDLILSSTQQSVENKKNTLSQEAQETADIKDQIEQQRYRNTGIPYFDYKENLTLGDIFLAKNILNLDLSYANMNLNANVKNTDVKKARSEIAEIHKASSNLLNSIEDYDSHDESHEYGNSFNRWLLDKSGGLINFADKEDVRIVANTNQDVYEIAKIMKGGEKLAVDDRKQAREIYGNATRSREYYLNMMAKTFKNAANNANEKYSTNLDLGVNMSAAEDMKIKLLNSMANNLDEASKSEILKLNKEFYKQKRAYQLLQEKGDAGINEAIHLLYSN